MTTLKPIIVDRTFKVLAVNVNNTLYALPFVCAKEGDADKLQNKLFMKGLLIEGSAGLDVLAKLSAQDGGLVLYRDTNSSLRDSVMFGDKFYPLVWFDITKPTGYMFDQSFEIILRALHKYVTHVLPAAPEKLQTLIALGGPSSYDYWSRLSEVWKGLTKHTGYTPEVAGYDPTRGINMLTEMY